MLKRIRHWTALVLFLSVFISTLTACTPPSDDNDGSTDGDGDSSAVDDIGAEYALNGPYTGAQVSVTGYTIFYPRQMDGKHPIITWGNGTDAPTNSYWGMLRHLASWGFVVIASDSMKTRDGKEMLAGVDYLIKQNRTPGSLFYRKLDPKSIATTGHSQGGGGAINAATDPRVTCTLPIAPARGDIELVKCPIFLIAGSEDSIVPAALVRATSYNAATAPTILGVVQGMGHFDFLFYFGNARGYITAWFMYQLKSDKVAARAFVGKCEICKNPDWIVQKKNFPFMLR